MSLIWIEPEDDCDDDPFWAELDEAIDQFLYGQWRGLEAE